MKPHAPKSTDAHNRALNLSRLLTLIFEDATDLTYADLEEALAHIHSLKLTIRQIKAGHGPDLPPTAHRDGSPFLA